MQLKQTHQIKNPNWQEANQLAVYKWSQGVEPGTNLEKSNCNWSEQDLNSESGQTKILIPFHFQFTIHSPFHFHLWDYRLKEMLYEVRYLKSSEDMILALAGQFKQLSHEPEKFRWLNGIQTHDLCDAGAEL